MSDDWTDDEIKRAVEPMNIAEKVLPLFREWERVPAHLQMGRIARIVNAVIDEYDSQARAEGFAECREKAAAWVADQLGDEVGEILANGIRSITMEGNENG